MNSNFNFTTDNAPAERLKTGTAGFGPLQYHDDNLLLSADCSLGRPTNSFGPIERAEVEVEVEGDKQKWTLESKWAN